MTAKVQRTPPPAPPPTPEDHGQVSPIQPVCEGKRATALWQTKTQSLRRTTTIEIGRVQVHGARVLYRALAGQLRLLQGTASVSCTRCRCYSSRARANYEQYHGEKIGSVSRLA